MLAGIADSNTHQASKKFQIISSNLIIFGHTAPTVFIKPTAFWTGYPIADAI